MWNNSEQLMAAMESAHEKLVTGDTDPKITSAEARLFGSAVKLLNISLEHAKLTGRLTQGSGDLPGFTSKTRTAANANKKK